MQQAAAIAATEVLESRVGDVRGGEAELILGDLLLLPGRLNLLSDEHIPGGECCVTLSDRCLAFGDRRGALGDRDTLLVDRDALLAEQSVTGPSQSTPQLTPADSCSRENHRVPTTSQNRSARPSQLLPSAGAS